MQRNAGSEFFYQLFALLTAVIIVHSIYVANIRPNADAILLEQMARQAAGESYIVQRSLYVVMKDYEQEACFILMLWALAIMGLKANRAINEGRLLNMPLLRVREGTSILPEDTIEFSRPIQALPEQQQNLLIPFNRRTMWLPPVRPLKKAVTRKPTDSTVSYRWCATSLGPFLR